MDRSQEQIREDGRQIPSPLALTLRRDRLSQLLARHVALIDEIQRSAKELTSGQDEYIASQIDRLRRAANDVHRAAAPVDQPVSAGRSGPWSAEHPCSHSPRSSNDEVLFNRKDSRPIATPQIPHPMVLPQASSGCLPTSIPRLNSSMSCDELLSMLDSVTNPGAVSNGGGGGGGGRKSKSTSKDNGNKDNTTGGGGSPVSRKRALRDTSSDGTDAPMPLLPPPAFRRNYSNNNMAEITPHHHHQQQQQPYRSATPTPTPPMPVAPNSTGQVQYMSAASPMMHHPPPLPRGHGSVNHLVAPHQTDTLAPSPFSTMAPSSQGPPPPQQQQQRNQQQLPPQVYHHHHHHPAPMQQQQQQHHYSSGPPPPPPPMMSTPLPHVHSHHHLQQQQQQHYSSAPLPMQGVGMSYPPPRQMPMPNGMQPPMRQMSPTPYGNMMGMPPPPPGWHNGPVMPPPHLRMNMVGPLPLPHHPYMGPPSMMGPPPRRGPLGLTGVAPPPGMLPMHHSHPPQYVTRPMSAPSPPPTMQMSMHAAAAALAAAPVAVNALNAQKMPPSTIPVPSGLPPVRVTPPAATPALPGGGGVAVNGKAANNETSLNLDDLSLPPMPSAQLLADLPSLSPHALLSPAGGLGDPSALSSLPLTMPHRDMVNGNDPFQDINHIHLSPEEFDAVLAAFDTPGLEDAQT